MPTVDHSKPFTDEEKAEFHNWSMDWAIEENERIHGDAEKNYPVEGVNTGEVLTEAGITSPPAPPAPQPAGQSFYSGPLVVEGENDVPPAPGSNGTRVPLPRDHPLTYEVEEGEQLPNSVVVATQEDTFDRDASWAEIQELNVEELKDNLKELDQPVSGSKKELQERLLNALEEAATATE